MVFAVFFILLGAGVWAYWPMLSEAARTWSYQPDYSHGFLVAPIALYMAWSFRDRFAQRPAIANLWGLPLLFVAVVLWAMGTVYYLDPLVQMSFVVWMCSSVLLVFGWHHLRIALPALLFLVFLFPLPFRVESQLRDPLQFLATGGSVWLLQLIGQPAVATGNVIHLGEFRLEVAQACSGLRMMVGFVALSVTFAILSQRARWERVLIVVLSIPIALACNILRITITGLLYRIQGEEIAQQFMHDLAGWLMMPVALSMLFGILWYIDKLFPEIELVEDGLVGGAGSTGSRWLLESRS